MSRSIIILLLFAVPFTVIAQREIESIPLSFSNEFKARFNGAITPTALKIPDLTQQKKAATDLQSISIPIKTDLSLSSSGQWTDLPNGNRLWRLKIQLDGAKGLAVLYDNFYLPKGSKLFVYSEDQKQILGAYTQQNNNKNQRFFTGIINGNNAIIEYYEPSDVKGKGSFRIFRVDFVHEKKDAPYSDHPFQQMSGSQFGFGASDDCESDIVCSEGLGFDVVKRGICRIMMVLEEGIGWCTGNVMNNTANDGSPLILSAYHCYSGYTPMFDLWRFDFNYEVKFCGQDQFEPNFQSVLGCELKSFWDKTDFLLLELNRNIPENYNVYFNGWDNGETIPANITFIHHPKADVKKLTFDTDQPIIFGASINWDNGFKTPPNHHFRVTMNEGGTFEIGSSGGGLFNGNKRIVGQLHGGFPDTLCRVSTAYFGRLHLSWEGGGTPESRLKDWLDPIGTDEVRINGTDNPVIDEISSVQGQILTPDTMSVSGVDIMVNNQIEAQTDLAGNYLIENLNVGTSYEIRPSKNVNPENGASIQDLILIQKHNLSREPFTSIYDLIASDVDNSQRISIRDLIELNKVILGRSSEFPNNTSWRFMPTTFDTKSIDLETFDFLFPESIELRIQMTNDPIDFTGIKIGDVNGSVDASE